MGQEETCGYSVPWCIGRLSDGSEQGLGLAPMSREQQRRRLQAPSSIDKSPSIEGIPMLNNLQVTGDYLWLLELMNFDESRYS
uniref:Uncharacterized protein n=1 Tax=Aegilops tauschii subsp. strangulata TaxID=200361 RepID=A0A453S3C0_AEGTS